MFAAPLGTGSAGNCHFVESGSTRILVDCGFGIRQTEKRLRQLGRSLDDVTAIVLTHEHHDHIRGVEKIAAKYEIPVYLTRGTRIAGGLEDAEIESVIIENDGSFRIGDIEIHAKRVIHDAADPACYVLEGGDGTRVGLLTDVGWVDPSVSRHLEGCDALFFESNHDLDMLREGTYPWALKRRIMSNVGHLSNDDSMRALERIVGAETKALCLIHLSQRNNHESIVKKMVRELMELLGSPAIDVSISRQTEPGELIEVHRRGAVAAATAPQMRLFG